MMCIGDISIMLWHPWDAADKIFSPLVFSEVLLESKTQRFHLGYSQLVVESFWSCLNILLRKESLIQIYNNQKVPMRWIRRIRLPHVG